MFSAMCCIFSHAGLLLLDKKTSYVNMDTHRLCVRVVSCMQTRPGGNALMIGIEIAYGGVGGKKL